MKNSAAKKLRQIPTGYLRVGVDPHKKRHAAVTMTEDLLVQSRFNLKIPSGASPALMDEDSRRSGIRLARRGGYCRIP